VKSRIGIVSGLLLATLMLAPAVHAQPYGTPPPGAYPNRRAMHHEMIAACANKAEGAPCSFSHEGKMVSGSCFKSRRGHLVCHAKGMGNHHGMHHPMGGQMPPGNPPPQ